MLSMIYSILFVATILSAIMVVFSRHAVYSALCLVITMISIAGIFILIDAQLAAFLQIIVYAGAIMVLFLFVIMLLNLGISPPIPEQTKWIRRVGAGCMGLLVLQLIVIFVRFSGRFEFASDPEATPTIGNVAIALLTKYLYAFEMTSVLILIAIIGAMALARRSLAIDPHTGEAEGATIQTGSESPQA